MTETEIRSRIAEMRTTGEYAGGRFGKRWQGFMPDGWLNDNQICDLADEHIVQVVTFVDNVGSQHNIKGLKWVDKSAEFDADQRNEGWTRKLSSNPAGRSMPEEDGIKYALALIAWRRRQKTGERAPWDPEPKNTIRFEGLDINYPTRRNVYLNGNWLCYVDIPDAYNQNARGQWEIKFPKWERHGFASEADVKPAIASAVAQLNWTKQEKTPEYEIDWKKPAKSKPVAEPKPPKKARIKITIRAAFERRGAWWRVPRDAQLPSEVQRGGEQWRPYVNISSSSRFQVWLEGLDAGPKEVDIDCNGVEFTAKRNRGRYIYMLRPMQRGEIISWAE